MSALLLVWIILVVIAALQVLILVGLSAALLVQRIRRGRHLTPDEVRQVAESPYFRRYEGRHRQ